jgi:hypothetical protein
MVGSNVCRPGRMRPVRAFGRSLISTVLYFRLYFLTDLTSRRFDDSSFRRLDKSDEHVYVFSSIGLLAQALDGLRGIQL